MAITSQDIRDMVGHACAALTKEHQLRKGYEKYAKACKQASSRIPQVLDTLEANNLIPAGNREKVAGWLQNPNTALQFLEEIASEATTQASRYSTGEPCKTAGYNGTTTPTQSSRYSDAAEAAYWDSLNQ